MATGSFPCAPPAPSWITTRYLWAQPRHLRTAYMIMLPFQIQRRHNSLKSEPGRDVSESHHPIKSRLILRSVIPQSCVCSPRGCDGRGEAGAPTVAPGLSRSRDGTVPAVNGALWPPCKEGNTLSEECNLQSAEDSHSLPL